VVWRRDVDIYVWPGDDWSVTDRSTKGTFDTAVSPVDETHMMKLDYEVCGPTLRSELYAGRWFGAIDLRSSGCVLMMSGLK